MALSFYKWLILPVLFLNVHNTNLDYTRSSPIQKSTEELNDFRSSSSTFHPYYVSVVEINHNATDKTLEISCKIFTDDFEKTLGTKYNAKVDLISPPDRKVADKFVSEYIANHLSLKADGKAVKFSYLGFEREDEVVWSYFQVDNITSVKSLDVVTNILHDLTENQINILHVTVNGSRKSTKLEFPKSQASFEF